MNHFQNISKTTETLETNTYNMCFQAQHLIAAWTKWRIIAVELDASAELDATEW
jgi:hypothetical protein